MSDYILFFDPGSINMAYCLVEIKTLKIIKWGLFSIKDSTNEGSCIKLAKKLDELKLTEGINVTIVIEQQPKINTKTITISGQIQMYYALLKMDGENISKIIGYHAGNKIKYYVPKEGDEPLPTKLDSLKKGHYRTKQILIEHCRRIMIHNEETQDWKNYFENNKKKDDISDSYVSALSYIQTHKLNDRNQNLV